MTSQPVGWSCCDEWRKQALQPPSLMGGGLAYPDPNPEASIEWHRGTWHVPGCCGGGCYVLNDLRYCPWCGTRLPAGE